MCDIYSVQAELLTHHTQSRELFHLSEPGHFHHITWAEVKGCDQLKNLSVCFLTSFQDDLVHCTFGTSAVLVQWKE